LHRALVRDNTTVDIDDWRSPPPAAEFVAVVGQALSPATGVCTSACPRKQWWGSQSWLQPAFSRPWSLYLSACARKQWWDRLQRGTTLGAVSSARNHARLDSFAILELARQAKADTRLEFDTRASAWLRFLPIPCIDGRVRRVSRRVTSLESLVPYRNRAELTR